MELQFKTNWGPLTGIGLPFLDVKSAAELAVGAYGWWKARERGSLCPRFLVLLVASLQPVARLT
jgi:hypothetical protein